MLEIFNDPTPEERGSHDNGDGSRASEPTSVPAPEEILGLGSARANGVDLVLTW
jgi:hypothetical protein